VSRIPTLQRKATPRAGPSSDGAPPHTVGRRRGRVASLVALALAGGAAGWLVLSGDSSEPGGARARASATATVTRQTLVEREDVEGTLGYAGKRTVVHRSESSTSGGGDSTSPAMRNASWFQPEEPEEPEDDQDKQPPRDQEPQEDQPEEEQAQEEQPQEEQPPQAQPQQPQQEQPQADEPEETPSATPTLTSLARAGSVVRRGAPLYHVNGEPVLLLYGSTPAYRTLQAGGGDGPDVRELEANLSALGFDPGTVDDSFTSSTAAAVSNWQDGLGLEQTGSVELGRVVFLPGPRRAGAAKASKGSLLADGAEVLETSSTERVVSVELDASQQSMARDGGRVLVTMPDGRTVNGRITSVGRVAHEQESDDSSEGLPDDGGGGTLVIDLTVKLSRKARVGRLDEAPVTVGIARETRRGVLAVPVTALLARSGGGYAVEVVAAGARRRVPVETGLFADGHVEVSGRGISEGTRVAVPQ
jgi:membrane fusion protein, multidrug efflux system